MQRSMASMVGMPVVSALGVRMGEIRDALIDLSEHRILAFTVEWEESQSIHQDDVLPLVDVVELNADVATIADELGAGHGLERDLVAEDLLRAVDELIDLPLRDQTDRALGTIADVLFDPQDGSIQAYEIAAIGDEPADPKLLVPHQGLIMKDKDALICPDGCQGHLHDKPAPRLDLALMQELGLEEAEGEEDVEVVRGRGQGEA